MDQVSPPPRSLERSLAPAPSGATNAAIGPVGAEQVADPGEDPYSPGSIRQSAVDPLAETLGALFGALLAILTLTVPLLGVLTDRRDEIVPSSGPARSIEASAPDRGMAP
jgi:hypothetical protein